MDTSDFRNGLSIQLDNEIFTIVEFQHVKPGKGGAIVRTTLKNMRTGAVVDKRFRAGERMEQAVLDRKMKKGPGGRALALTRNVDIVTALAKTKGGRTVVGFAAETHDLVVEARRKLREKGLDLIVANDVTAEGAGFGSDTNVVHLLDAAGLDAALPVLPKEAVAARILDWVSGHRRAGARVKRRRSRGSGSRQRSTRAPRPSV